jgi:hypothetical protein
MVSVSRALSPRTQEIAGELRREPYWPLLSPDSHRCPIYLHAQAGDLWWNQEALSNPRRE